MYVYILYILYSFYYIVSICISLEEDDVLFYSLPLFLLFCDEFTVLN